MSMFSIFRPISPSSTGSVLALTALVSLAGCSDTGEFAFSNVFGASETTERAPTAAAVEGEVIEKDVEDPSVFSASEAGLWDGRPSLGGVWVAHPDAKDPERVMIRNSANGKFVVGALFRRERANPGPRLQVSSDAAAALDILAGAPVELSVVALRKERIEVAPPEPAAPEVAEAISPVIEETTLDPIAAAGAAIEAAEPTPAETAAAPSAEAKPASSLSKPFIQVGIYNQEENAERVADQMRSAGMVPTVRSQNSGGSPFWRVVVGPAGNASERKTLQDKIKAVGFADAYPVSN
jgi:cell division septation protein DedD